METYEQFVMDPDVYDAIDFVSEMEGGLGRSRLYDDDDRPCCMIGAAHFAGAVAPEGTALVDDSIYDAWYAKGLPEYSVFDRAHGKLSRFAHWGTRIPWPVIAQEMGVVRGEAGR